MHYALKHLFIIVSIGLIFHQIFCIGNGCFTMLIHWKKMLIWSSRYVYLKRTPSFLSWITTIWLFPKYGGWNPNKPIGFFLLTNDQHWGCGNGGGVRFPTISGNPQFRLPGINGKIHDTVDNNHYHQLFFQKNPPKKLISSEGKSVHLRITFRKVGCDKRA